MIVNGPDGVAACDLLQPACMRRDSAVHVTRRHAVSNNRTTTLISQHRAVFGINSARVPARLHVYTVGHCAFGFGSVSGVLTVTALQVSGPPSLQRRALTYGNCGNCADPVTVRLVGVPRPQNGVGPGPPMQTHLKFCTVPL